MAYELEGRLLEVCDCRTLCPCWVGENPDNGTCKGTLAWHFDKGAIDGVDVSGLTFGALCDIPGNVLEGKWRIVAYVDDRATPQQQDAILAVWTGKKGGPVAELAQLVGEVAAVERVPMTFDVREGKGSIRFGTAVAADLEPFRGPDGKSHGAHGQHLQHDPRVAGVRRQGVALRRECAEARYQARPLRAQRGAGSLPLRKLTRCLARTRGTQRAPRKRPVSSATH